MSALHNYVDLNGHSPISQQIQDQPRTKTPSYLTAPKKKSNRGKSHTRLLNKLCLQAIEDPNVKMHDKIKAAGILERLQNKRNLAARRRKKERETKTVSDKKCHSSDILCQVANG